MFSVNLLQILLEWLAKESLGMIDMDVVAKTWLREYVWRGKAKVEDITFADGLYSLSEDVSEPNITLKREDCSSCPKGCFNSCSI